MIPIGYCRDCGGRFIRTYAKQRDCGACPLPLAPWLGAVHRRMVAEGLQGCCCPHCEDLTIHPEVGKPDMAKRAA